MRITLMIAACLTLSCFAMFAPRPAGASLDTGREQRRRSREPSEIAGGNH
jgi:hypothetical protein